MRFAVYDELSGREVVDSEDSCSSADGKVLIRVGDCHGVELVSLSLVRAGLEDGFRVGLPQVPV